MVPSRLPVKQKISYGPPASLIWPRHFPSIMWMSVIALPVTFEAPRSRPAASSSAAVRLGSGGVAIRPPCRAADEANLEQDSIRDTCSCGIGLLVGQPPSLGDDVMEIKARDRRPRPDGVDVDYPLGPPPWRSASWTRAEITSTRAAIRQPIATTSARRPSHCPEILSKVTRPVKPPGLGVARDRRMAEDRDRVTSHDARRRPRLRLPHRAGGRRRAAAGKGVPHRHPGGQSRGRKRDPCLADLSGGSTRARLEGGREHPNRIPMDRGQR